tara:strand:+ start:10 stop:114 length:105 start_codon:yes stop_codon:yes gene_type:complete
MRGFGLRHEFLKDILIRLNNLNKAGMFFFLPVLP